MVVIRNLSQSEGDHSMKILVMPGCRCAYSTGDSKVKKLFLLVPLLLLAGCTLLQKQTMQTQVDNANKAITLVLTTTDQAYQAKLITKPQAQSVSTIAHQINPLLDSAAAAAASGDAAGATKTMTLINSLLAGLQAYVPPASLGAK
jgi:hypothetical protein